MSSVPFASLIETSERYDQQKTDFRIRARDLRFDSDGQLVVLAPPLPYDDGIYAQQRLRWLSQPKVERTAGMTDHAVSQLHNKLGPAHYGRGSNRTLPTDYLAKFPPAMRADILNWTLERSPSTWKVRLYEDRCRAVLDGDYPRVWNTEVLRQLARVLRDRGGLEDLQVDRPFVSPDEFFLRLWWSGAGTGNYRIGATFGNSETGTRTFMGVPMIRRTSCANSIVVTDTSALTGQKAGFQMVHYRGASAEAMMTQFYAQLPALMNASAALINRMIAAESVVIPDFRQVLDGLMIEHGWKQDFLEVVDEGTEGQRTQAGLVNGITYAAHAHRDTANPQSLELETLGGRYLLANPSVFQRLAVQGSRAKRIRA